MLTIDIMKIVLELLSYLTTAIFTALILLLLAKLRLFPMIVMFVNNKQDYDRMTDDS